MGWELDAQGKRENCWSEEVEAVTLQYAQGLYSRDAIPVHHHANSPLRLT